MKPILEIEKFWKLQILNSLISRNFCGKMVRVNFRKLHTVKMNLIQFHVNFFQSPEELDDENKELLPVMFFIHGGAFYMGAYFGHGPKVLLEHDVVLVEIQYRLGPLGFMCLNHPEAAGNMGKSKFSGNFSASQILREINCYFDSFNASEFWC